MACGKSGHSAQRGPSPWLAYLCPLLGEKRHWWGVTGQRIESLRCSECGNSGFDYANGQHFSKDGVRGYRCLNPQCGAIKPERAAEGNE